MADELVMLDEGDQIEAKGLDFKGNVMVRIPDISKIRGNYIELSKSDALQMIANLAVQVAIGG